MILKIVTIIQARLGSTRLPNKIMLSAAGKQLLLHMVERVQRSEYAGTIVVATTTDSEDDEIFELCRRHNIECFRGHPTDLLDRHYKAAKIYDSDIVVKIPSDCPLIDPKIIDRVIKYFLDNLNDFDFVSNLLPPTYPDGNDVEVTTFDALEYTFKNASLSYEREHTTPFIWTNPEIFRISNVKWEAVLNYSNTHRWTLDYEDDYTFIRAIFEELYHKNKEFGLNDILNLLDSKPHLKRINNKHIGKFWYKDMKLPIPQNEIAQI
jgi:spore coat polysaccharide biosynthesis protein SpsF